MKKKLILLALVAATASFFIFYRAFYEIPILMYHSVNDSQAGSSTVVSPDTFERQMEFLKVHYYNVLSLTEVADRVKNGKGFAPKSLAITFDDGYQDNIKNAFPILKKMGFPATVFVITDNIGKEGWLSEEDLRILDGSGITIGSHTVHHAFLPALSSAEAEAELKDSKKRLEEVLGHPVTLFSYPAGGLTPRVEDLVKETCYAGAVTTNNGKEPGDAYAMHRIKITEAHGSLFDFWAKVSGLYQFGKKRVTATDGGEAMAE